MAINQQEIDMSTYCLFLCARKPVCEISLGAHDLELRFSNERATSLPGDGETEYSKTIILLRKLT